MVLLHNGNYQIVSLTMCKLNLINDNESTSKNKSVKTLVDVSFKPNNVLEDSWVGIQVKTTNVRHLTYSFHINNIYKN